ncbi:MAG: zinc-binding alcohol dehydrogenase [Myxococcota bacterium]
MSEPTTSRALWIVDRRRAELRDEPLPSVGPGQVRVRTRFTAISRGTERLVVDGRVPPELADAMRAPHQAGAFPWPVKYGYCNVGVVEAGALPVGTRVFCLYPHQDRFVVDADQVVPLPPDLPDGRAVLTANAETALNAVWDARVGPGDRVAVVGAGVVGALVAWLCGRIPGTDVTLIDVLPARAAVAEALGVRFASPDRADGDRDVVFHTSASPAGLATAIGLAGVEATVIELSWYGAGTIPAPLGGAFHHRRLTLRSSQVGGLPVDRRPRWTYRRRVEAAMALLAHPAAEALIDGESSFADLPRTLIEVADAPGGWLCHRVRYEEGDRCSE